MNDFTLHVNEDHQGTVYLMDMGVVMRNPDVASHEGSKLAKILWSVLPFDTVDLGIKEFFDNSGYGSKLANEIAEKASEYHSQHPFAIAGQVGHLFEVILQNGLYYVRFRMGLLVFRSQSFADLEEAKQAAHEVWNALTYSIFSEDDL